MNKHPITYLTTTEIKCLHCKEMIKFLPCVCVHFHETKKQEYVHMECYGEWLKENE